MGTWGGEVQVQPASVAQQCLCFPSLQRVLHSTVLWSDAASLCPQGHSQSPLYPRVPSRTQSFIQHTLKAALCSQDPPRTPPPQHKRALSGGGATGAAEQHGKRTRRGEGAEGVPIAAAVDLSPVQQLPGEELRGSLEAGRPASKTGSNAATPAALRATPFAGRTHAACCHGARLLQRQADAVPRAAHGAAHGGEQAAAGSGVELRSCQRRCEAAGRDLDGCGHQLQERVPGASWKLPGDTCEGSSQPLLGESHRPQQAAEGQLHAPATSHQQQLADGGQLAASAAGHQATRASPDIGRKQYQAAVEWLPESDAAGQATRAALEASRKQDQATEQQLAAPQAGHQATQAALEAARKQLQAAERQLEGYLAFCHATRAELHTAQQKRQAAEGQLAASEAGHQATRAELEAARNQRQAAVGQMAVLEAGYQATRVELGAALQQLAASQAGHQATQAALCAAQTEVQSCKGSLAAMQRELDAARREVAHLNLRVLADEGQRDVEQVAAMEAWAQTCMRDQEQKLSDQWHCVLHHQKQAAEKQLAQCQADSCATNAQLTEGWLAQLHQLRREHGIEIRNCREVVSEMRSQLAGARAEVNTLQVRLRTAGAELDDACAELAALKAGWSEDVNALQLQQAEQSKTQSDAAQAAALMAYKAGRLAAQQQARLQRISEAQRWCELAAKRKRKAAGHKAEELQGRLDTAERDRDDARGRLEAVTAEKSAVEQLVGAGQQQATQLRLLLDEQQAVAEKLSAALLGASKQQLVCKAEIGRLQSEVRAARGELEAGRCEAGQLDAEGCWEGHSRRTGGACNKPQAELRQSTDPLKGELQAAALQWRGMDLVRTGLQVGGCGCSCWMPRARCLRSAQRWSFTILHVLHRRGLRTLGCACVHWCSRVEMVASFACTAHASMLCCSGYTRECHRAGSGACTH
jgi:hypothetical protein